MTDQDRQDPLQACMETVQRLEEENEHLRTAAGAFGQLAERLNQSLQEERRTGAERRSLQRINNERRSASR
ncbi:MAG: hypothetical protein M3545_19870 [Acidobacteriota bacterium]|nr:hypothetical protein [Acidobacteriota bacterium]